MVTIIVVELPARMILLFALAIAFALHAPIACGASMMPGNLAHSDCHHHSHSDAAHHACCDGVTCMSALESHREAATPAVSLESVPAPIVFSYVATRPPVIRKTILPLAFSPPPSGIPLVIRLNTLLI